MTRTEREFKTVHGITPKESVGRIAITGSGGWCRFLIVSVHKSRPALRVRRIQVSGKVNKTTSTMEMSRVWRIARR